MQFDPSILNIGLCKLLSQRGIPLYSKSWKEHDVVSVHAFIYDTLETELLNKTEESVDEEQFITLLKHTCQRLNAGPEPVFAEQYVFHKSLVGIGEYVQNAILAPENIEQKVLDDTQNLSLTTPSIEEVNLAHATAICNESIIPKDIALILYSAARSGHTSIVSYYKSLGCDINVCNLKGETALHLAAKYNNTASIAALIALGADVNAINRHYRGARKTALHIAAKNGNNLSIVALIRQGADIHAVETEYDYTALHLAALYGHTESIITLITNGADVRATCVQNFTALHLAAENGHTESVVTLIENGADVHAISAHNETAVYRATYFGRTTTVTTLIAHGANVDTSETLLQAVARNGHRDMVTLLINLGADVHAVNPRTGETALMQAASTGQTDIVCDLIARGVDVNAIDNSGETALMKAIIFGNNEKIVITLIIQGARTDLVSNNAKTALLIAKEFNHINLLTILRAGLDALQRICQQRDKEMGLMIAYRIFARKSLPFELVKRISSFDCDPTLEYLAQNSLLRLKESIIARQIPLLIANRNLIENAASSRNTFKEEIKEHKEEIERSNISNSSHSLTETPPAQAEPVIFRISSNSSISSSSSSINVSLASTSVANTFTIAETAPTAPLTVEQRRSHQNTALQKRGN